MKSSLAVAYVTGTVLQEDAAHARQIDAMCRAFAARLGGDFALIRPIEGTPSSSVIPVHAVGTGRLPRWMRQIRIAIWAAMRLDRRRSPVIFSREFLIAAALWLAGYRVVLELHQLPRPVILAVLRWLAAPRRFGILAISHGLEADLRRHLAGTCDLCACHDGGFPEEHPTLDQDERNNIRAKLDVPAAAPLAVYTGSLYKGRDAQSFDRLAAAFPDVVFVMVGGRGALLEALRTHYGDLPNVRCVGQKSGAETRLIQAAADILLFPLTRSNPLWRYTSPLKLFEYMAAGRTLVASNIGSVGEILNETNAYVFDGDDEESMSAAFGRALTASEDERAAKQARCLELIRERYNWHRRVAFILDRWPPGPPEKYHSTVTS